MRSRKLNGRRRGRFNASIGLTGMAMRCVCQ
jgi:hypothetical protein